MGNLTTHMMIGQLATLTNRISAVRDPRLKSQSRDPRLALKNKRRANTPLDSSRNNQEMSSDDPLRSLKRDLPDTDDLADALKCKGNQKPAKQKRVRRVQRADNFGEKLELCRTIHNCLSSRGFRPSCSQLLLACKNKLAAQTRAHRARKRSRAEAAQNPEVFAFAAGDSVVHRDRGMGQIIELTDLKLHVKFESERKVFVYSLRELQRDNKLIKSESSKRPRLESQETEPQH